MSLDHWYFAKTTLDNSPSRKHGISEEKEQAYLQQTANFIQEMGRKLSLPLLCINTAVLFTQRFYVFHPITLFEKFSMGASALFLAAKVEEQPRNVEHICQIAKILGIVKNGIKDTEYCQELMLNEHILLQTLGFEVQVQHPHQHVLRLCHLFQASKTLSQTSYILSTYCLHLTRMCLVHKPVYVACLCIYMACKLTNWEIPLSREGKHWFTYGDSAITDELLETMCDEFLSVLKQCPENCKRKTLTASHENLIKKLSVHTTGLPIIKEADQIDSNGVNPTPSSSRISPTASEAEISKKILKLFSKESPPVGAAQIVHKPKQNVETPILDPPKITHSSPLNKPIPSPSINASSAFASSTTKTDGNLMKTMQGRLSHSTSQLPKQKLVPPIKINKGNEMIQNDSHTKLVPPIKINKGNEMIQNNFHTKLVPPIKINKGNEMIQNNNSHTKLVPPIKINKANEIIQNNSHTSVTTQSIGSLSNSIPTTKRVPSLKITIPRSRLPHLNDSIMPAHRSATVADVKTEKMALTLTPASMGEQTIRHSSKKFKPN